MTGRGQDARSGRARALEADDPKGLIREAYRMDEVTLEECRSIFMDWALSLPDTSAAPEAAARLLATHGARAPDHPMSIVLSAAESRAAPPARRGGWRGRRS